MTSGLRDEDQLHRHGYRYGPISGEHVDQGDHKGHQREDESPTITRGETFIDYMENGTGTVSTYAATDPERASIVWSLDDADKAACSP